MTKITICTVCLTIYLYNKEEGDDCDMCKIGTLVDIEKFDKENKELDNEQ